MPLTCGCDVDDDGDADWYWREQSDYSVLAPRGTGRPRRPRCQSCFDLINFGATVIRFERFRIANTDIEERIYGEGGEIPLAPYYHCERCADLFFSLTELGFCATPVEDMRELVREYAAMQGIGR
jgi:hypothetical protein